MSGGGRSGGEVGWLVGSAVSPGRWFPFLSGAGPSPLYHGGEPALFHEVILLVVQHEVVLEVIDQEMAYLEGQPGRGQAGA